MRVRAIMFAGVEANPSLTDTASCTPALTIMHTTLRRSARPSPSTLLGIPPRTRAERFNAAPVLPEHSTEPARQAVLPPPAPECLHDWTKYWFGPVCLLIGVSLLNWMAFATLCTEEFSGSLVLFCLVAGVGFCLRGLQILQNSRSLMLRQRAWIKRSATRTL